MIKIGLGCVVTVLGMIWTSGSCISLGMSAWCHIHVLPASVYHLLEISRNLVCPIGRSPKWDDGGPARRRWRDVA